MMVHTARSAAASAPPEGARLAAAFAARWLLTAEYRLVRAGSLAAAGLACWYWLRPAAASGAR